MYQQAMMALQEMAVLTGFNVIYDIPGWKSNMEESGFPDYTAFYISGKNKWNQL